MGAARNCNAGGVLASIGMNGGSIQVGYPDSPAVIEARTHMKG